MDMFVEIPTVGGSEAVPLHSIRRVRRVGPQTVVMLYGGGRTDDTLVTTLSVSAVLRRIRKVSDAQRKALAERMG